MELRDDDCYGAIRGRDARFDGRFFTGVKTTRIYCRPICPAPCPKRENCRFFPSAAAAEAAGFRPCLRCRPETAPGTPAWIGAAATVSRALRLIDEGAFDANGLEANNLDAFSARLGIGARQLRRLFQSHLGASPLAVAHTRRVQIAKRLIDETALPMIDVANAAGFGSVRRFNAAIRDTYGRSPRVLRRGVRGGIRTVGAGLVLRLSYRPPYDWASVLAFLAARSIPGVEAVVDGAYRRSIAVGELRGIIEVSADRSAPRLVLRVPVILAREVGSIASGVRRLFDLDAEPRAIATRLAADALLAPLVRERPGLRVPGAWDRFELAVRGIVGQQVSVRAATTMLGRIAATFGEPLREPLGDAQGEVCRLFPSAAVLAGASLERIGLTRARAATIRALAAAVASGSISLDTAARSDEVKQALLGLPGIGAWTAEYIAMRGLGEPDAFPATDLGLKRAVENGKDLLARAERWRPWRAYAVVHLWAAAADARKDANNGRSSLHVHGQPDRRAAAGRGRRRPAGDPVRGVGAAAGMEVR